VQIFEFIDRMLPYPWWVKVPFVVGLLCLLVSVTIMLFIEPLPRNTTQAQIPIETQIDESSKGSKQPIKKIRKVMDESVNQKNKYGDNQANVVKGDNHGVVGNNNTVNNITNNFGPPQRVFTKAEIDNFRIYYPDTTKHIRFMGYNGVDAEMNRLKNQIITALRASGYNDIDEQWNMYHGPYNPEKMTIEENNLGGYTFHIPLSK
jgi:hypothetical protein